MRQTLMIFMMMVAFEACNNNAADKTTTNSSTLNTNTGNVSDGGPNHGAGDTNDYSRMNDMVKDSLGRDTAPK